MDPALRPLRFAAHAELATLVVMLANLAGPHLRAVSSLMGPAHGCAYLFVVGATWRITRAARLTRVVALVPGIGGLLVLRQLRAHRVSTAWTNPGCEPEAPTG
ncbi:DUF3817 domain-containing protein [Streptomyces sp. NPDC051921]|uniref:DUF3817 domain-containing protein n=1 Tax=Streptomyces sp. NPDC051921 TaxID=3155806 RepID=UPI00343EB9B5